MRTPAQPFIIGAMGGGGVFVEDLLRLRELCVDPRQLIHRRRDAQTCHVRRRELLVQQVRQYLCRVLPVRLSVASVVVIIVILRRGRHRVAGNLAHIPLQD